MFGTTNKNSSQGSAYVFVLSGTTWSQQAELTASDGAPGDEFGTSVAISGDTVVIGAENKNNGQGAAYVFVRNGTVWNQQQKLTASNGAFTDFFGWSVAVDGDTALVGATGKPPRRARRTFLCAAAPPGAPSRRS